MTDQHRATPEQWPQIDEWALPPMPDPVAVCLLELRARVEALEKVQRPLSELSRQEVRERALRVGEGMKEAAIRRAQPMSLVERVMDAMDEHCGVNRYEEARAAIREVAAWLAAGPNDYTASPDYFTDILCDEVNR